MHRAKINTAVFFDSSLLLFDHDAVISLHQLETNGRLSRKSVLKTTFPFMDAKYAKNKKKIFGVSNERGSGHINIVNIDKKRV
jgi:hypothetical protein